ncbi:Ca2+-binding RTX toxin-like protein [Inquilinus ginsengisoli]|uniref:calcium-binding protein n=1 Tax=Inquilinus ginsengisoli TaxID=363840 RepID=UPI003D203D3D
MAVNGDDFLVGGAGADILAGGDGIDTVSYKWNWNTGVAVMIGGIGTSGDAHDDFVMDTIENIEGSEHPDYLVGSAAANVLTGLGGHDALAGMAGNDALVGGNGNDKLYGGAGADLLLGGDGVDEISYDGSASGVTVTLGGTGSGGDAQGDSVGADIENIVGSGFKDVLKGAAAANQLSGGSGDDKLNGLAGDDGLSGGDDHDLLEGAAGADTLEGGGGDDFLDGGAGADTLVGGDGVDTIDYDGAAGVTVNLTLLTASGGDAQGDVIGAGIENIRGTGIYNDILTGSAVANVLSGFGGHDTLNGLGGADTLNGMSGNDLLVGGAGADRLDGGDGTDTADYSGSIGGVTINLAGGTGKGGDAEGDTLAGVEAVKGSVYGDTMTGDGAANVLDGLQGDDVLRGGAGADALQGGFGIDMASYYSGTTGVVVSLVSGNCSGGEAQGDVLTSIESVSGSQGNDAIFGNAGVNVLQGWNGGDSLVGGGGKDFLNGGAGLDRFYFTTIGDSAVGADADVITDFSHAQTDRIDVKGIDANSTAAGDQAFGFIGTALYTGVAGQLRFAVAGGVTTIAGDVNGDKVSDFHIQLTGAIGLVASDFLL